MFLDVGVYVLCGVCLNNCLWGLGNFYYVCVLGV